MLAGGVVLVVALVVVVPWAYIHLVEGDQPAALSVDDVPAQSAPVSATGEASAASTSTSSSAAADGQPTASTGLAGTWTVGTGSQAGYRVKETLAGQSTTAVGRTSAVSGSLTIKASAITAASFTVQMAQVTSDRSQRDGQFTGRIMDTARYPTAVFTLTQPIELGAVSAVGDTVTLRATGNLTLHGTTNKVSFDVEAKRTAAGLAASGDIAIRYADYGIDNPSFGFVSVGDSGTIEFLLVATRD